MSTATRSSSSSVKSVKSVNYIDVINDIQEFYKENAVNVWCPSAGTSVKFKPLTVQQFKTFIELQVAAGKDEFGVVPGLQIIKEINNVIVNNGVEHSEGLLDSLTTLDRDAVILQLRAHTNSEAEIITENDETAVVNLVDIVKKLKDTKLSPKLKSRTKSLKYSSGSITIDMSIPTLRVDQDINDKFRAHVLPKIQKGKKHLEKEAEKILSQVYFLEICKYINTITIIKNDTSNIIDFHNLENFDDNFTLLESLPTKAISQVSTYMSDVREYKDSIFSYVNEDDQEVPLNVDVALFAGI